MREGMNMGMSDEEKKKLQKAKKNADEVERKLAGG